MNISGNQLLSPNDDSTITTGSVNSDLDKKWALILAGSKGLPRQKLIPKGMRWLIDHKKWLTHDGKAEKDFL